MESINSSQTSAEALAGKFERTVDRAASSAHQSIDKASGATHPAIDRLATGAHQAVDSLDSAAATTVRALETKTQQLRDVQSRLAERCSSQLRDKPVSTLGIAIAAGFLLAMLLKRR